MLTFAFKSTFVLYLAWAGVCVFDMATHILVIRAGPYLGLKGMIGAYAWTAVAKKGGWPPLYAQDAFFELMALPTEPVECSGYALALVESSAFRTQARSAVTAHLKLLQAWVCARSIAHGHHPDPRVRYSMELVWDTVCTELAQSFAPSAQHTQGLVSLLLFLADKFEEQLPLHTGTRAKLLDVLAESFENQSDDAQGVAAQHALANGDAPAEVEAACVWVEGIAAAYRDKPTPKMSKDVLRDYANAGFHAAALETACTPEQQRRLHAALETLAVAMGDVAKYKKMPDGAEATDARPLFSRYCGNREKQMWLVAVAHLLILAPAGGRLDAWQRLVDENVSASADFFEPRWGPQQRSVPQGNSNGKRGTHPANANQATTCCSRV